MSRPSASTATTSQPSTAVSAVAPKDENLCLESELPLKPPRQKSKPSQPVETAIDNLDGEGHDVSVDSRKCVVDDSY